MPMLKDVSMEMAKGIIASKSGFSRSQMPSDINRLRNMALQSGAKSVADALGFLAGDSREKDKKDSYKDEPEDEEEEEEEDEDEKSMRFGIRAGFSRHSGFDYHDYNNDINIYSGLSFGAGSRFNVPITDILRLDVGLGFYYREVSAYQNYLGYSGDFKEDEFTISIPILLQLGNSLYAETGIQLDFPTKNSYKYNRSNMDFGFVLGAGYMFTDFGIDIRTIIGLTDFIENYGEPVTQFGLGVSYFIF
jgi:hypothetical protein